MCVCVCVGVCVRVTLDVLFNVVKFLGRCWVTCTASEDKVSQYCCRNRYHPILPPQQSEGERGRKTVERKNGVQVKMRMVLVNYSNS